MKATTYCPICGNALRFIKTEEARVWIYEIYECDKCELAWDVKKRDEIVVLESCTLYEGWDDPHYLPEDGYTCEVVGCMEVSTCGMHWGNSPLYLRLCSKHHMQAFNDMPMPPIKQWALDGESKRDKLTGVLPLESNPSASGEERE